MKQGLISFINTEGFYRIFQNFRLYQRSFGKEQEVDNVVVNINLDTIADLPSLSEAVPVEAYEAEQKKKAEDDAKLKAEMDLLAIEQNAKSKVRDAEEIVKTASPNAFLF